MGGSEGEIKYISIQNPWIIFFREAVLFCAVLGSGIASAFRLYKILEIEKIILSPVPLWHFLLWFLLATLFIFLIPKFLKFQKGKTLIFRGIFVLAIFGGGGLALSLWMPDVLTLIFIAILLFLWLKWPLVLIHNLAVILGIAGVGAVLGLRLSPWFVVSLLIILSVYDFIAVYKTKHMIKMAKEMLEAQAILGLIVPQRMLDFAVDLKEVKPGGRFLILGGGDAAFPLLLAVSLVPHGITPVLVVSAFALIGLAAGFLLFVSQKVLRPMPALPSIALFSIIGFLITLLL